MLTISTERRTLIMDYAIKTLGEFLASESTNFIDGWQAYDAHTEINIWTDDSEESEESDTVTYNVTAYYYNTDIREIETHNFYHVGTITIKKGNS